MLSLMAQIDREIEPSANYLEVPGGGFIRDDQSTADETGAPGPMMTCALDNIKQNQLASDLSYNTAWVIQILMTC